MTLPISSYTGDGSQELFTVTFPYLAEDHVFVIVDDVPTAHIFENSSTVRVTPAPELGAEVIVRRQTSSNAGVVFEDTSVLTAKDLNKSFTQARYLSEEASIGTGTNSAQDALSAAGSASAAAASATDASSSALTATNSANSSIAARNGAETAQVASETAQAAAEAAEASASGSAASASADATVASTAEAAAIAAALAAEASETNAAGSATNADVSSASAASSASDAAASLASTVTSEAAAAASETAAASAQDAAASFAGDAAGHATNSATSAANAASSATSAAGSATTATAQAGAASTSASNAAADASTASSAASSASTDASTASTAASAASTSASEAATSASGAAASATAAQDARDETEELLGGIKVRSLRSFGTVGDCVVAADGTFVSGTDDTAAINAALAWMNASPDRSLVGNRGDVHRITAVLTGTGHFNLDMDGCAFFKTGDRLAIDWDANVYGPFDLTSDYIKGDTRLNFANNALPVGVAPNGMVMKIASDAVDRADRDEGSGASQFRTAEFFVVGNGSTTSYVEMVRPLQFTEGVDPTSIAGDEPLIDSFTTAMNARIVYADPNDRFYLANGKIFAEDGNAASWNAGHMTINGFIRPRVHNMHFGRGYNIALKTSGTYQALVTDCYCENLENNTGAGQYGYGVADAGDGTIVENLRVHNVRHGYTSGVARAAADSSNAGLLLQCGRTVGGTVRGGIGTGGSTSAFDTHHSSDYTTFENVLATNGGKGVTFRGRHCRADKPRIRNCGTGISVLTEYASGNTDDDFWTAAKDADSVTSAVINDAVIDCNTLPLYSSYSFTNISGRGRYRAADHCFVGNQGGIVIITGHHEMTSIPGSTTPHNLEGCIYGSKTNAAMTGAFPRSVIIIEGTVIIDATDAPATTITGIELGNDCSLIVRGRLKLQLPAGATYSTLGTGADIRCEGSGVIEVGISGAADSTLFNPQDMAGQRVRAIDGSAWWDDVSDDTTPVRTAANTETAHTVTLPVGETPTAFIPEGQNFWYEMYTRGGGRARLTMRGSKTGTTDSCRIVIRSNSSNYVGYLEIDQNHNWWALDVEVMCRSDGSYTYQGTLISQDNDESVATSSSGVRVMDKTETQAPNSNTNVPFRIHFDAPTSGDSITVDMYEVTADFGGQY